MRKTKNYTAQTPSSQAFAWIDHYLKPVAVVAARIRHYPRSYVESAYWLLALLGLLPALRADLLFPFDWAPAIAASGTVSPIDDPFGLAAPLAVMGLVLITIALRERWRLFAAIPYLITMAANSSFIVWLGRPDYAYAIAAFTVFLLFAAAGSVRTLYFLGFLAFLVLWRYVDEPLTWNQVIEFGIMAVVASLVYETFRQNWPLMKDLGRANSLALLGRTFSLWSPTILLILAGLWIGDRITTGTEELLYQQGAVQRYCGFAEAGPDVYVECPDPGLILSADELQVYNGEMGQMGPVCNVWDERYVEIRTGPMLPTFACPPLSTGSGAAAVRIESWQLTQAPFFVSLDRTLARRFDVARWEQEQSVRDIKSRLNRRASSARGHARELFGAVPESTGLEAADCAFADIGCGILNLVKGALNRSYREKRAEAEEAFVDSVDQKAREAGRFTATEFDEASAELDSYLVSAQADTATAVTRLVKASELLRLILTLWLVVIAIKSFLYVFARVIFDKNTAIHVDLLDQSEDAQEGKVQHLQEVSIPGTYPYDIYYKADYQPLGPAPLFWIPQWRASALSRLRFGAWNMSRVSMPTDDGRGLTFNSIEAEYLVDWQLKDGEEVVFSYRNFVAMNDNIELRTVVSLRVATLLMGRIVFHTACCRGGNGRLILRTRGKPATAEQVRQSIPSSRLIAWNRYARFSVDSHLTRRDIFLNGFNLRRSDAPNAEKPQGILIVEADARGGRVMVGTLRFAKNFLLPI